MAKWTRRWGIPLMLGCIVAFSLGALGISAWTGIQTYHDTTRLEQIALQNQAIALANRELALDTKVRARRQLANARHLAYLLALERRICLVTPNCSVDRIK